MAGKKLVFEGPMSAWETSHEGLGGLEIGDVSLTDEVDSAFPSEWTFVRTKYEGTYRITVERIDNGDALH